jgi:hypothetical protein
VQARLYRHWRRNHAHKCERHIDRYGKSTVYSHSYKYPLYSYRQVALGFHPWLPHNLWKAALPPKCSVLNLKFSSFPPNNCFCHILFYLYPSHTKPLNLLLAWMLAIVRHDAQYASPAGAIARLYRSIRTSFFVQTQMFAPP